MGVLNLKPEIDKNSGFCFGVISAIKKAEETLDSGVKLYSLGEIVHNDEEIKRLEKKGLVPVSRDELKKLCNSTVLFRAHGEPPDSYEIAKANNNIIVDASCPIILKIQQRVKKSFENNEIIYIFGKPDHAEVVALNGQIKNKAVIFQKIEDLDLSKMPKKITLYSQTTKSLEEFRYFIDIIQQAGIEVKVNDTICRQVSNREHNIIEFCKRFNRIIFVSGTNSSNGRVLYNICKRENENSYFISSSDQINAEWFNKNDKVGICGATSTPMWLMKEVEEKLLSL
jgi:4-hydroxy-3-methylbut-2-enyl diphosphate reductase